MAIEYSEEFLIFFIRRQKIPGVVSWLSSCAGSTICSTCITYRTICHGYIDTIAPCMDHTYICRTSSFVRYVVRTNRRSYPQTWPRYPPTILFNWMIQHLKFWKCISSIELLGYLMSVYIHYSLNLRQRHITL